MISHYGLIANIIQVAQYVKPTDESVPKEWRRFHVGDVSLGGTSAAVALTVRCMLTLYAHGVSLVLPFFRQSIGSPS